MGPALHFCLIMMRWISSWKRHLLLIGLLSLSLGFTGHERFVELEGYFNGRSEADFRKGVQNVRAVLPKGTRAQILAYAKLPSGNYALKVKTVNGETKGQDFWIYYDLERKSVKTFENAPSHWAERPAGRVAETQRDVPALAETPSAREIVKRTDRLQTEIRDATAPRTECSHCVGIDNVPVPEPRPERRDPV